MPLHELKAHKTLLYLFLSSGAHASPALQRRNENDDIPRRTSARDVFAAVFTIFVVVSIATWLIVMLVKTAERQVIGTVTSSSSSSLLDGFKENIDPDPPPFVPGLARVSAWRQGLASNPPPRRPRDGTVGGQPPVSPPFRPSGGAGPTIRGTGPGSYPPPPPPFAPRPTPPLPPSGGSGGVAPPVVPPFQSRSGRPYIWSPPRSAASSSSADPPPTKPSGGGGGDSGGTGTAPGTARAGPSRRAPTSTPSSTGGDRIRSTITGPRSRPTPTGRSKGKRQDSTDDDGSAEGGVKAPKPPHRGPSGGGGAIELASNPVRPRAASKPAKSSGRSKTPKGAGPSSPRRKKEKPPSSTSSTVASPTGKASSEDSEADIEAGSETQPGPSSVGKGKGKAREMETDEEPPKQPVSSEEKEEGGTESAKEADEQPGEDSGTGVAEVLIVEASGQGAGPSGNGNRKNRSGARTAPGTRHTSQMRSPTRAGARSAPTVRYSPWAMPHGHQNMQGQGQQWVGTGIVEEPAELDGAPVDDEPEFGEMPEQQHPQNPTGQGVPQVVNVTRWEDPDHSRVGDAEVGVLARFVYGRLRRPARRRPSQSRAVAREYVLVERQW